MRNPYCQKPGVCPVQHRTGLVALDGGLGSYDGLGRGPSSNTNLQNAYNWGVRDFKAGVPNASGYKKVGRAGDTQEQYRIGFADAQAAAAEEKKAKDQQADYDAGAKAGMNGEPKAAGRSKFYDDGYADGKGVYDAKVAQEAELARAREEAIRIAREEVAASERARQAEAARVNAEQERVRAENEAKMKAELDAATKARAAADAESAKLRAEAQAAALKRISIPAAPVAQPVRLPTPVAQAPIYREAPAEVPNEVVGARQFRDAVAERKTSEPDVKKIALIAVPLVVAVLLFTRK